MRWEEVEHCYGPATDVPRMLSHVRSRRAKRRERALDDLFSSLCHQGSVYPASPVAVPHLADLATDADVREGTRVMLLALVIGIGASLDGRPDPAVALDARHAVRSVTPRLLAAAPAQTPHWRALCLSLCASFPDLAVDPASLVADDASPSWVAARRLTDVLLRDDDDLDAAIARAAKLDDDIAEFEAEALGGLPADERARQLVFELASRG